MKEKVGFVNDKTKFPDKNKKKGEYDIEWADKHESVEDTDDQIIKEAEKEAKKIMGKNKKGKIETYNVKKLAK